VSLATVGTVPESATHPLTTRPFATRPPLQMPAAEHARMIGHLYDGYPLEACGLLVGRGNRVTRYEPCDNVAASARIYTIDPRQHLRIERRADDDGLEVIGVVHSHTHSEPYPSPTDVEAAPDPSWHYVIVSLKRSAPEVRSYRIVDGAIAEEPIAVG
jgi:[CysO sulfur-carrier protein]-S-L-cysteine hydrolase